MKKTILPVAAGTAQAAPQRVLAIDDLFQMRDVGDPHAHLKSPHG